MSTRISFDTETYRFCHGNIAPRLVCLTYVVDGGPPGILVRAEVEAWLRPLLEDPDIVFVLHNAAFDMAVLCANFPKLVPLIFDAYEANRVRCTLVREALYLLAMGQLQDKRRDLLSLASVYQRRTGRILDGKKDGPDSIRLNYHTLDGLPASAYPAEAIEYAMKDAVVTDDIFVGQEDLPDEFPQTRAAFSLYLMACTGIRADPERTAKLRHTLEGRIGIATQFLIPTGLLRPSGKRNIAAIKEMVKGQYVAAGRDIPYVVPKKKWNESEVERARRESRPPNISYAAEFLADIECVPGDAGDCKPKEFVVCDNPLHRLNYRTEDAGELSKYVVHLESACSAPINYSVTTILSTGRTAISKPPLQQLPQRPGVRECIIPPPGWHFFGADLKAIELVCLGQILLDLFGYSDLAKAIQDGKDPHTLTAAMMLDVPYEEAAQLQAWDDTGYVKELAKTDVARAKLLAISIGRFKEMRKLAKALDFGVPGGMGAETFISYAKGYGYRYKGNREQQIEEAKKHIRQFKKWYPDIDAYLKYIAKKVDEGGGVFTFPQPGSGRIRGGVNYTAGANGPFQAMNADLCKLAHWWITKEMYLGKTDEGKRSPLFGSRSVIFVHDEFISQSIIELAPESADRQSVLMLRAAAKFCPDVPTQAKPWVARCWDKDAKEKRDGDGRLMVWETANG